MDTHMDTHPEPAADFARRLSAWLKESRASRSTRNPRDGHPSSSADSPHPQEQPQEHPNPQLPSWVFEDMHQPRMPAPAASPATPTPTPAPTAEALAAAALPPMRAYGSNSSTPPDVLALITPRRAVIRRVLSANTAASTTTTTTDHADQHSEHDTEASSSSSSTFFLPHDILLAILSHLPSRANAQQYYDRSQPSDLLSCSRVNMAWRIAALSTIWHTILLPDPLDRSCRRLLHLLASSHASAQITGKNYDMTEIVQRVEVDLLEATDQLLEEREQRMGELNVEDLAAARDASITGGTMTDHITILLQYISPFRTLSIQLPQEIESTAAELLTRTTSVPVLEALVAGVQEEAHIKELDIPSPMYCSVSTFPGMLKLISNLPDLRALILGYSSRDWPLLKAIISLQLLESLCVFDSCWSNQIWIYLLSSLGSRLRALTVLQGRRPLQGAVLQEGIAPHCRNLTSLSIPFIQLLSGPGPVLKNEDLIPVIKACHELQTINISGQRLLSDAVLEAMAELWGLQMLDIRDCSLMNGQRIKSVRWQSIQRVRMSGCTEISKEFMDLVLQVWRSSHQPYTNRDPSSSSSALSSSSSTTMATTTIGPGAAANATIRYASVLDFNADVEDPVEMGWVRQREDEPPLDLDEDHFFADWYC
ncbi:hypothetical protein KVV02_008098 [Mortierella alpina]|uniref:F-box domain-containing protein n=1 Tax=Mortierella alpina TaxID=64518 RepID=A0A9P8A451_MORAP|nr:hypothetical protein KVV02_008098 [Mortierella alpina]